MRLGQCRLKRQGFSVCRLRFDGSACFLQEIGEVDMALRHRAIRVDRPAKLFLRLANLVGLPEQQAKVDVRLGMAWIVLCCPLVVLARQPGIPRFFGQKAKAKVNIWHFGSDFECLVEAHAGLLQQAVLNVIQALEQQRGRIGRLCG